MALDLTPEMRQIGGWFQQELEANIRKQVGIDGKNFVPVKQSTAISRQSKNNAVRAAGGKGRRVIKLGGLSRQRVKAGQYEVKGLDYKRLFYTKKFVDGAFRFVPKKDNVKVMTWPGTYPGSDVSYRDIVLFNNRGSSMVNRRILMAPKIFPITTPEVESMQAYKKATAHLKSPATLKKVIGREYKKKLTVLLG